MNKTVAIIAGVALLGFIIFAASSFETETSQSNSSANQANTQTSPDTDSETQTESDTEAGGVYTDYSEAALAGADENDAIVIFFHASWCITCNHLDDNLQQAAGSIPGNVRILKADFDNNQQLRQNYGVTFQHTLVQVDNRGNYIQDWRLSRDLEDILTQIN